MIYENKDIKLVCDLQQNGTLRISGSYYGLPADKVELYAANPIQRMMSYMGSGMPFANVKMAFENSPNYYQVTSHSNFSTVFWYPNSYYSDDGWVKVAPSIFIRIQSDALTKPMFYQMTLPDPFQLRTMSHRPDRNDPEFYAIRQQQLGVRSQYELHQIYAAPYLY